MEILKDAFSNPIETLLEYEPWTDKKEKEDDIEQAKPEPLKTNSIANSEVELNELIKVKSPDQSSGSGQQRHKTRSRVSKQSSNMSASEYQEARTSPIRKKTESSSSHSGSIKADQKIQGSTSAGSDIPSRRDFDLKGGDRELSPISCNSKDLIEDQESIIQQKQEEMKNQLNLTVIDEEPTMPKKQTSGTKKSKFVDLDEVEVEHEGSNSKSNNNSS